MYQVFIKTLNGKTIALNVQPYFTIDDIKELIQQNQQIPKQLLRLSFNGKNLQNPNTLSLYHIQKQSTLQMVLKLAGGSPQFNFNSLQKKIKRSFTNKAPKYRMVSPGLNLQAKCKNKNCQAYNKLVWVEKGFGQFNMGKQLYMCKCPICNQTTETATNFGYFKTFIMVHGKQANSSKIIKWQETVNQNKITTFENNDEEMRKWNFLEITTKEVK